ncbi:MAG: ferritin [Defluviitaleaceae bacterium]|nr:ferritin [Defluviitaleaceae bacterium]
MLSEKLLTALSDQVNAEYYSAYLYLAMSAAATKLGLKGTAHWIFTQSQEEMAHGTNIYNYIIERGETPAFKPIEKPVTEYTDVHHIFNEILKHEQSVTKSINNLATIAMTDADHAAYQFLMWYVNEQVEEESGVSDILDKLKLVGSGDSLLALDNELGARVFVNPFPAN